MRKTWVQILAQSKASFFPRENFKFFEIQVLHEKKFSKDAAPRGRAVAFTGGELCDYTFGYFANSVFCIYIEVLFGALRSVYK